MLLCREYEVVWEALIDTRGELPSWGCSLSLMEKVAARLGYRMARVKPKGYDRDRAHGIVNLHMRKGAEHAAVLSSGLIYDTDGFVWPVADFLSVYGARAGTLLYYTGERVPVDDTPMLPFQPQE